MAAKKELEKLQKAKVQAEKSKASYKAPDSSTVKPAKP